MDIAVEGEGIGYTDRAKGDDELAVCEEPEDGYGVKFGEYGSKDVGDGITCSSTTKMNDG